jgi:outer membrane protein assembly factor BamB
MGSPSFRGWSWSSNWWVFEQRGANAARTPEEKAAYVAAAKQARATGAWDPVLDAVSDRRLGYAVEAQGLFNKTLSGIAPKLVTASACPHRNVESYPPVSLGNVQEVDLQAQWEQILPPYSVPHGVDFYKRPGKRAWTHPEIWNDAGTGEQILPTLFQGVMRGADGVGLSGRVPPWGTMPEDGRLSYDGTASVFRALTGTLRPYGAWLTSLHSGDEIAIVVSGRMLRLDEWGRVCGQHFARLFEAYVACLHAHHPASYVFVDDLKGDTLARFKVILVVGQTVEMEPALADAIRKARAAKVRVFHDGTCRPELVKEFEPLGLSFNQFEKDPRPAEDDHAYWRFPAYCVGAGRALGKVLDAVTPPPAVVEDSEVFLSERRAEEGRYLFVVNNAAVRIEPGLLWRTTLGVASRRPQTVPVRLRGDGVVYDVFALKEVRRKDGRVEADCRHLPARIFAVLPAAIDHVTLRGPIRVAAGRRFLWSVAVEDAKEQPIAASIPVRVRLLTADGTALEELFVAAGSRGASGSMAACLNVSGDQVLEATELLSGKSVRVPIKITPAGHLTLSKTADNSPPPFPTPPVGRGDSGREVADSFTPAEQRYGPHIKEVAVGGDGSLALMNAMNWDDNLLAVDVKTGEVRWRQRLGQYFAFAPQGLARGFAAQGFDFDSAEGYHLYLGGPDGEPRRRFALYGLPQRLPHRFVPAILNDRINNFAVPTDGAWVASAGDLGLAVWDRDGKLLWSQDWWKTERHTASLLTLDAKTLVVVEGMKASAYEAATGKRLWEVVLAATGEVRQLVAGADGKTCYVLVTSEGGRIMVIRDGRLAHALPAEGGRAIAVSPGGSLVAFVAANQLKLSSLADGLQWILPADDTLHSPRFSPDGKRIVACSDLGSVYVAGSDGRLLWQRDLGALAAPAWLPDGDLLLATWMGTMMRLDGQYAERWRTRLEAPAPGRSVGAPVPDRTPTTRVTTWGNAEARPLPLTPNLLDAKNVVIKYRWPGRDHIQLQGNPARLVDGKAEAPKQAWLPWDVLGHLAEGSNTTWILIDTYRTQLRVTGITIAEDPEHPESWLRDVRLEYWDAAAEQWRLVQPLLSNAAVHTHRFARPVEAARFRIVLPKLMYGNLRLAQIVLHGEALGPSHPDVIARRPVAVLFDEGDDIKEHLTEATFRFEGPFAGGRCLLVPANGNCYPPFQPPVGHVIPNWDFEIAENPGPGQYRFAQFAWKALSPQTRGILLRLDGDTYGHALGCYAGEFTPQDGMVARKIADAPPREWQVVRVDLWEVFKTPVRIRGLRLATREGAAVFDQILLGRSEKDLPPTK